jgi:hypothetical protein
MRPIPYYDPAGRLPSTYEDYCAGATIQTFTQQVVQHSLVYNRLVLVFVNADLYPAIQPEFNAWLSDVGASGYSTKVITVLGGRAANLRQILQAHRDSGLVGTVMVGNLPVAWWSDDPTYGEDYPLDFFFTDLDGAWSDANGDGRYDGHSGNTAPDIWLGRIDASRLTYGAEAQIIHDYFLRNHLFRTGQLAIPHRGLVLSNVFYTSNHGMSYMLSNVTNYGCNSPTSGSFYKNQLLQGYEFVHLVSHSSPWVNSFFDVSASIGTGSVFNFEIPALGPHAVFYFLNACMCGRYTERDNLGNWYALSAPYGQVVLASTQTMYGIDDLSDLYSYLGADSTIGGAFLEWHRDNYSWFSAMCILGDPTLKVDRTQEPEARPKPPEHRPSAPLDWTTYPVDTTNYVSGRPRLGCSQGRIRLLYDCGRIVRSDNFFAWFNGTSFTRPESVAWHDYYDLFPSCCTDSSGRFWMAWQSFRDYDAGLEHFQVFSTYYNGSTWSGISRVGPQSGYHDLQPALAAARGDTVWCAFQSWRNGQADIWVSSEVHGGSWSTPVRLTTDSLEQLYPCIAVDHANHPWVFWMSQANGRWCIQGRVNQGGWQPVFTLDTAGGNGPARAAVDAAGNVWVIYSKAQGLQSDIYYSRYFDLQWTSPAPLTADSADDMLPDIAAAPDGVVWACWQSGQTGAWSIMTSHYAGGWTTPEAVTEANSNNYDPSITVDASGNVWTAWASDRRGYWNIYAAMAPVSGVATEPGKIIPVSEPRLVCAPNPVTRGSVRLQLAQFPTGPVRIALYDALGKLVLNQTLSPGPDRALGLDVRTLPAGIYLVKAGTGSGLTCTKRLVILH